MRKKVSIAKRNESRERTGREAKKKNERMKEKRNKILSDDNLNLLLG